MSIAGIGSQGAGNLSQVLSSLFSKLDANSSSSDTTTLDTSTSTTATAATDGGLTGSTKPSLSSMILGVLMGMQQQSSATTSGSSSTTDATSGSSPVSKLFTAMDTDSDGSVTQSEMESYIESVGGSASDADNLYSQLNTSGSSTGISESDLENQAPPPPPPGGDGQVHHHHHSSDSSQASSAGDQLVSALDSDSDGSVSESELSDFLTANGGTSTEASSLFSSLSSDGTSGVTASDFDNAISSMTSSFATNPYATILNALDSFSTSNATASKTAGSTVSVSA